MQIKGFVCKFYYHIYLAHKMKTTICSLGKGNICVQRDVFIPNNIYLSDTSITI